jgi:hypothetical protein
MSATMQPPAVTRAATDPMRRRARLAGVLYLLTFVSIPTLTLYNPIRDHADFILGAGSATGVLWGAASEVVVGLAGISTAVVLFPVLKRQNESAALGLVAARLVETCLIFVSVISLLTIMAVRSDVAGTAGADTASLTAIGQMLLAVYDKTFLVSQSLMPVIVDLLLGYLLYRSRLVPRFLPVMAIVGAPLLLASDIAVFFGVYDKGSPLDGLAVVLIAAFEFLFGVWLVVKGFDPCSPLLTRPDAEADSPAPVPSPRTGDRQLDDWRADVS